MKKLVLILSLVTSTLLAQEYTEIDVFNLSGVTGDTIRPISLKKLGRDEGRLIEVDFTSVNCDSIELDLGYATSDVYPLFIDSVPLVSFPITLDKTVHATTYKGLENNSVGLDLFPYNGNYLWLKIKYYVTCTSGIIKLRYSK